MKIYLPLLITVTTFFANSVTDAADSWKPAEVPIMTRWGERIDPENVLPEYPRPQMVRPDWKNLNGLWDFAITEEAAGRPEKMGEKILVPFPVESALSGVKKRITGEERMWYRREFTVPPGWKGQRILLHFGAVDWEASVYVNGQRVGAHSGGFTPFTVDITESLDDAKDQQELVLSVWDPSSDGVQPVGKQQLHKPKGTRYTPVSGIWQTVWLEPVPMKRSIVSYELLPNIDNQTITVETLIKGHTRGFKIKVTAWSNDQKIAEARGKPSEPITLTMENPTLWSPENPFLYDLKIELSYYDRKAKTDKVLDTVEGYFGMRKISVAKDAKGIHRLCLNNKPQFQFGPLDQGWWPGGLYTAPTDDALAYDIEVTKKLGMNLIRKHAKIEPARWYYHCDRLGMLVWQDMPNKDSLHPKAVGFVNFRKELMEMVDSLQTFPCIVMWVAYNEGWGAHKTEQITALFEVLDPSRLVNSSSGGADKKVGDAYDIHVYPGPEMPSLKKGRASVLGEFGGLGFPVEGHLWKDKGNWGYRSYKDQKSLEDAVNQMVDKLYPMMQKGLSAAVYTQISDVEGEINGFMTYDRKVIKIDVERFRRSLQKIYGVDFQLQIVKDRNP